MRALILALSVGLVIGCGKAKDTAQDLGQKIEAPELMHTWAGKCAGSGLLGLSTRSFYQFDGNKAWDQREFYKTGDCHGSPSATVRYAGDLDLQSDSAVVSGARNIHVRWQSVATNAADDVGKGLLAVYPLTKVPSDEYNIAKADSANHVLYLGDRGSRQDLSNPADRPTKLADQSPFHEEQKDLSRWPPHAAD